MDNTGFNQVLQYKEYSTSRFRDAASHICASHWTSFYNSALPIRFFAKMPQSVRLLLSHWEGKKRRRDYWFPHLISLFCGYYDTGSRIRGGEAAVWWAQTAQKAHQSAMVHLAAPIWMFFLHLRKNIVPLAVATSCQRGRTKARLRAQAIQPTWVVYIRHVYFPSYLFNQQQHQFDSA